MRSIRSINGRVVAKGNEVINGVEVKVGIVVVLIRGPYIVFQEVKGLGAFQRLSSALIYSFSMKVLFK